MSVGYRFGNLIIRKDVYYPAERRRYWYVSCEVCNRDKELFPSLFRTNKQQIEAGSLPCGCAKQVKWNTLQYKTLIQRECEGSGLQVYKLPEKIISSSNITLKSSSGLFWKVTVKNFLKGVRPKWFKQASKTKLDKLITKYSNEDVTITVDQEGLIYERCHRCEIDKFSSLGLRSDFKTNTANLRNKVKMCRCSNKHHKLLYEWEILLSKKIQNLGGKFLAIEDFEKYKTNAWVYYLCRKGNLSKSRLYNLWWGDGWCRCCTLSGTGHYLYITLWKLSGKVV
ncbi:hypothetical protein NVP1193O_011 [Vibrio phage 1.193.O._10N.286.52.C6]|nr:hypothetical protein NVP1193O_011 [Vibrio phage 1.193.O._10N.286.52.C6]